MGKNNHEELLGGAPEATSNKQTVEDNLLGRPHVAEKSFAPEAKKDALAPKTPEERFAELQRLTSVYLSEDDEAMLAKAFRFASEAHEGQCRKSGEPFVPSMYPCLYGKLVPQDVPESAMYPDHSLP